MVLGHVSTVLYNAHLDPTAWPAMLWSDVNEFLRPVRMPLFFAVSGLLAASSVAEPTRDVFRRRFWLLYHVYVVWTLLFAVLYYLVVPRDFPATFANGPVAAVPFRLLIPSSILWYLAALALYFLVATVGRRVPWPTLGLAAALSLALASGALDMGAKAIQICQYLVFFLLGAYAPGLLRWFAGRPARRVVLPVSAVAFIVLWFVGAQWSYAAATLVAVPLGVGVAASVPPGWRVAEATARLGRGTLGVYVLHMLFLAAGHCLVTAVGPAMYTRLLEHSAVALLLPPVLTCLVVWLSLRLRTLLERLGCAWLFTLPGGAIREPAVPAPSRGR